MKIVFDIDGTLWKVNEKLCNQVPDYNLIQVLRWFWDNGDEIFVWSGGGVKYAQEIVDTLGLTEMVTILPKIELHDTSNPHGFDIAFDDDETGLAKVDITIKRTETHRCYLCKVPYIPDEESVIYKDKDESEEDYQKNKRWDGHTFKANCKCMKENFRLCVG